jgi:hypothetical protein
MAAALVVVATAVFAPTAFAGGGAAVTNPATRIDPSNIGSADSSGLALRRDPAQAVAAPADLSHGSVVLRRDSDSAVSAPADLTPAAASVDGFNWGDAGIGAAAGAIVALAIAAGYRATRNRRPTLARRSGQATA